MHLTLKPGRKIMGRLAKGDDLLLGLEKCAQDLGITLGEVQAIGAVTQARVGYYDQFARKYMFLTFPEPQEILSLVGNISIKDNQPFVHAHLTLADQGGRAFGGHLAEGALVFACEFWIQEYTSGKSLVRHHDEETGLFLWPKD